MKIKILTLYILAFVILFFCSCSEAVDTPARVLRSNSWSEKSDDDIKLNLYFKNDDAVLKVTDKKKEYIITGDTLVTENEIKISDPDTLTDFVIKYTLTGDSVKLTYKNKTLKLNKIR